jgi:hypothetical protein
MKTPTIPFTLLAAAVLTLSACNPGSLFGAGTEGEGSATPDESTNPTSSTDPSASADPDDDGSEEDSEEELEAQITANCPEGRWLLDNDDWADALEALLPAGSGTVRSVEGPVVVTLASDGSYQTSYDQWTLTFDLEQGTSVITRDGTDTGTWSSTDSTVNMQGTGANSEVSGYVETDAGRFDMPTVDGTQTEVLETFGYRCEGRTMEAITDEGTYTFTWEP